MPHIIHTYRACDSCSCKVGRDGQGPLGGGSRAVVLQSEMDLKRAANSRKQP